MYGLYQIRLTSLVQFFFKWIAGLCLLISFQSSAIIIRHDKQDGEYLALAKQFSASMAYSGNCAATVIDQFWVITAAHCISPRLDYPVQFEHLSKAYPVENIYVHPQFGEDHDLAMIQLRWPIQGAKVAKIYRSKDELGQEVYFVGKGKTGNGHTGDLHLDGLERAATNRVKTAEPYWLTFEFDQSKSATAYEGVSGIQDSGGPAFKKLGSKLYLLGVGCCQIPYQDESGAEIQGHYGSVEYYSRISEHQEWIQPFLEQSIEIMDWSKEQIVLELNQGNRETVKSLMLARTDWYKNTELLNEVLLYCLYQNDNELARFTFQKFPQLKTHSLMGMPLAEYAYKQENPAFFKLLVEMGIDLSYQGFKKQNYLSLLTWQYSGEGYQAMVTALLEKGVDINAQDSRGDTALHLAGFVEKEDRIAFLVEQGADLNLRDNKGNTLLLDLVIHNKPSLVELVLALGANPDIVNRSGETALSIAKAKGYEQIVALLSAAKSQSHP